MRTIAHEAGHKLDLKNRGDGLEVFFIGVGSAFATTLNNTNFLLLKGDTHIMVDFGATGPKALMQVAGLQPTDIEVVMPTHSHADHIGGFECLALMNRYVGTRFMDKPKMKMIVAEDYERILWEHSLMGGLQWNEENIATEARLSFADFFDVIRPKWKAKSFRETFEVDYGGIHIEMFRTKHIPEQSTSWEESFVSFGIFVDNRLLITGDTRFDPDMILNYADKSEAIFHDVQFFEGSVHTPLSDLETMPKGVKSKMYLMHYADNWYQQDIKGFAGWAEAGTIYRCTDVPPIEVPNGA